MKLEFVWVNVQYVMQRHRKKGAGGDYPTAMDSGVTSLVAKIVRIFIVLKTTIMLVIEASQSVGHDSPLGSKTSPFPFREWIVFGCSKDAAAIMEPQTPCMHLVCQGDLHEGWGGLLPLGRPMEGALGLFKLSDPPLNTPVTFLRALGAPGAMITASVSGHPSPESNHPHPANAYRGPNIPCGLQ